MKRSIFLIGMMGCGKSTMGRHLSRALNAPLIDLDEDIVRHEKKSIPAIFAEGGDAGFRVVETAALRRACEGAPAVVATGGGIVTREENIALMREHGLVVWLNRPIDAILGDVRQDTRPNLAGDKEERMRTLFAQREALYRRASDLEFDNSTSPGQAAKYLVALPEIRALL